MEYFIEEKIMTVAHVTEYSQFNKKHHDMGVHVKMLYKESNYSHCTYLRDNYEENERDNGELRNGESRWDKDGYEVRRQRQARSTDTENVIETHSDYCCTEGIGYSRCGGAYRTYRGISMW
ncbi:hypothetical protein Tco_0360815 [Tanacetum coccineum]